MKTLFTILLLANFCFGEILNLDKAKEIAIKNNIDLQTANLEVQKSKSAVTKSLTSFLPTANLTGSYTYYTPAITMSPIMEKEDNVSYGISVNQPIFTGGNRYFNYDMQKKLKNITEVSANQTKLNILSETEIKFINLLEKRELVAIAEESLKLSKGNEANAQIKYNSGVLSKAALLKIQTNLASAELNLINSRNLYLIGKIDLANFLQIPNDFSVEKITLENSKNISDKLKNLNNEEINNLISKSIALAEKYNSNLKKVNLSKNIDKISTQMAKGSFSPVVNLSYSYNNSKSNLDDEFVNNGMLTLSASLPIFPIYDKVLDLEKANLKLKESELSIKSTNDYINLSIKRSVYNLITFAKKIEVSAKTVQLSKETYAQNEIRFKNGISSASDLLDAKIMFISAENNYVTDYHNFLKSKTALLNAIGIANEKMIFEL